MSANKINTISFNIDVAPKAHDMGRNLLRGAGLGTLDTITEGGIAYRSIHAHKDGMEAVVDGIDGNKGCKITTGSDETDIYRGVFFIAAVNMGETYTLSAWVKGTGGQINLEVLNSTGTARKNNDGTDSTRYTGSGSSAALTSDWRKVSFTFTVDNKNAGYIECNFYTNQPGSFILCEPKLERGDTATAFCLNEADLTAAVYDIVLPIDFNASYSLHEDSNNNSDNNALDLTISGTFSVFTVVNGVRKLYDGDDLSFIIVALPYSATGKVEKGIGTVSLVQSNISAKFAPVSALLEVHRTSTNNIFATKNITISMHPKVFIDKSNGLLVRVTGNTKSIGTLSVKEDEISQKVQEIGKGLEATGIDISHRRVDVTADNFTVKNNKGEMVLGTDADKNIFFTGTIRANNFFHNVCVWGYNRYYYLKTDKKYYNRTEYDNVTRPDDKGNQKYVADDFATCSGPADIVVIPWVDLTYLSEEEIEAKRTVVLPDANDFEGKMIEVVDTACYNSKVDFYVMSVTDGWFSAKIWMNGDEIDPDSGLQSVTFSKDETVRFVSIRSTTKPSGFQGDSYCYWFVIRN